jgi:DNA-binding beta-propeller fold protein YncE
VHVLPQLRELERRFAREIVIIGVHSGKYHAERVTDRIREAALRLGNLHPVVNDRQFRVWRSYAVQAWPTLVVIDPKGYVLGTHAGEFTSEMLEPFIEQIIGGGDASNDLNRQPMHFTADVPALAPTSLRYPGKVTLAPDESGSSSSGRRIAIADSANHRVLVGTLDSAGHRMQVERVVGGDGPGFEDGELPRFASPQGLAFGRDALFVADAENHAIRVIDPGSGRVRTLAGTGTQLRTRRDMDAGAMSSPWDLTLVGDTLFVAMAGIHQLWAVDVVTGRSWVHAGTAGEDIRDGAHAEALLAQPMGIASHGSRLFFVDAESSAVRWADTAAGGQVGTIVGTGLFDFGDEDGAGDDVRMQHQQGIARHRDGRLLVADSYNDALKWVDPATRQARTWLRGFHEPAGLVIGDGRVYVADTNAHRIAVVNESGGDVSDLELRGV